MKHGIGRGDLRSQSAMEYLMTYGWAILIVAVVLGALYSLGVFNMTNLQPKVPGGQCHVWRPNGPGSTFNINLAGSCTPALPQYAARFSGQNPSGILVSPSSAFNFGNANNFTVVAWVVRRGMSESSMEDQGVVAHNPSSPFGNNYGICIDAELPSVAVKAGVRNGVDGTLSVMYTLPDGLVDWHQVALVYASNSATGIALYVDGALKGSRTSVGVSDFSSAAASLFVGSAYAVLEGNPVPMNGSIANVQIYNTSLTADQLKYLYQEGIGGVPVALRNLVGWWPLNGDFTDYSGNNNNGAPTAMGFSGSWTGGYYH